MSGFVAVGGSFGQVGSGGWDVWPLVAIVVTVWIARRVLNIAWGIPLLLTGLASSLVLPPIVHAWGVVMAGALVLVVGVTARVLLAQRLRNPPEIV